MRTYFIILLMSIVHFLNAQNVGIGTNSPMEKLHIDGNVRIDTTLQIMNGFIEMPSIFKNIIIGSNNFSLDLNTTENIAIGYNSQNKIETGSYNTSVGVNSLVHNVSGHFNVAFGNSAGFNNKGDHNTFIGTAADGLNTNNSTAIGYFAKVTQSNSIILGREGLNSYDKDKVGIGTSSPSAQLALGGANSGYSGDNVQLLLSGGLNEGTNLGSNDGTFKLRIEGYNNDGPAIYPIYAIDENDQVDFYIRNRPSASGSATLYIAGNAIKPGGGLWSASSDRRLKKDIVDYNDGLDIINQIHPVKFHYNKISGYTTSTEHIGVIAQELEPIAPYMVSNHEIKGEDYLQVDNSAMIYMLVNAVQELSEKVDALTHENQELKVTVESLTQTNPKVNVLKNLKSE